MAAVHPVPQAMAMEVARVAMLPSVTVSNVQGVDATSLSAFVVLAIRGVNQNPTYEIGSYWGVCFQACGSNHLIVGLVHGR